MGANGPKSPTSVIPAQSLPPRRRGRESIPGKVRHHYPGTSLSRGPLRSGGESGWPRIVDEHERTCYYSSYEKPTACVRTLRSRSVQRLDPVSILLKPALPASIRGPKALQTIPKCPGLQIRRRAEWNTLKQLLGRELAPTGSPAPNRCGCRGVIPLQAMQVTFTVATQVDA